MHLDCVALSDDLRSTVQISSDLKRDVRNHDDTGGESERTGNTKEFRWRVTVSRQCVDMNIDSDIGSHGEPMLSGWLIYNEFKSCESNSLCFVHT